MRQINAHSNPSTYKKIMAASHNGVLSEIEAMTFCNGYGLIMVSNLDSLLFFCLNPACSRQVRIKH